MGDRSICMIVYGYGIIVYMNLNQTYQSWNRWVWIMLESANNTNPSLYKNQSKWFLETPTHISKPCFHNCPDHYWCLHLWTVKKTHLFSFQEYWKGGWCDMQPAAWSWFCNLFCALFLFSYPVQNTYVIVLPTWAFTFLWRGFGEPSAAASRHNHLRVH